jgi:hypothetical protein
MRLQEVWVRRVVRKRALPVLLLLRLHSCMAVRVGEARPRLILPVVHSRGPSGCLRSRVVLRAAGAGLMGMSFHLRVSGQR